MALDRNPTKTRTIENNWMRDINRRWRQFTKDAITELRRMNDGDVIANQESPFTFDMSMVRTYMAFYNQRILDLLLGTTEPPNWQAEYQLQAYQRGVERARAQLISQGASLAPTAAEVSAAQGFGVFTATPSLGVGFATAQMAPIHSDALEFLFSRSYESLNGWTDALARETRQILVDAVEQGQGITTVTKNITDRIGVSRSRAQTIARTEIVQALQRGEIEETDRSADEIGEELMMTWQSALLVGRTRELHWQWHGDVITTKEARRRIGVSPWNCVCNLLATIPEANTERRREKFATEKRQFEEMEDSKTQLKVNRIMMML